MKVLIVVQEKQIVKFYLTNQFLLGDVQINPRLHIE